MALQLGMKKLGNFSDQLAVMLSAGIPLRQALDSGERKAPPGMRPIYRRIKGAIDGGQTFSQALDEEGQRFPIMYRRMVFVGEESGTLDSVLTQLGKYYTFLRTLWMRFIGKIAWPVFEYWFAVLLIAAVCFVMGAIVEPGKRVSVFKFLNGWSVLMGGSALFFGPILLYKGVKHIAGGTRVLHTILMNVPIISYVMRSFALARFAWCMEMTTGSGVNILNAIKWSLEATGNQVFVARGNRMIEDVRLGMPLPEAFSRSRLFPPDFLEFVETGATAGQLPDMFSRMAKIYFGKCEHALQILSVLMFIVILLSVAGLIGAFVISFWVSFYKGQGLL